MEAGGLLEMDPRRSRVGADSQALGQREESRRPGREDSASSLSSVGRASVRQASVGFVRTILETTIGQEWRGDLECLASCSSRFAKSPLGDAGLETTFWRLYASAMKMTFAIPDELGRRFRKAVPAGERSAVVRDILRRRLRPSAQSLQAVCRRVNKLEALERDMAAWERFDDQAP